MGNFLVMMGCMDFVYFVGRREVVLFCYDGGDVGAYVSGMALSRVSN